MLKHNSIEFSFLSFFFSFILFIHHSEKRVKMTKLGLFLWWYAPNLIIQFELVSFVFFFCVSLWWIRFYLMNLQQINSFRMDRHSWIKSQWQLSRQIIQQSKEQAGNMLCTYIGFFLFFSLLSFFFFQPIIIYWNHFVKIKCFLYIRSFAGWHLSLRHNVSMKRFYLDYLTWLESFSSRRTRKFIHKSAVK